MAAGWEKRPSVNQKCYTKQISESFVLVSVTHCKDNQLLFSIGIHNVSSESCAYLNVIYVIMIVVSCHTHITQSNSKL